MTVPRLCFFCESFVLFMSCVCHALASVHCCLVVTCWQRADLLTLVCDDCVFVTFPCGSLGQVWYLIVSIPDLCCLSYFEWDEHLPVQDEIQWFKIDTTLRELSTCYIQRYIRLSGEDKTSQLLVFCDASKYAYATTVHFRQQISDTCINNLIVSKARLAPNHEISIPRMELYAALIGSICIKFVERELKQKIEQKHIWLDSQCVLNWIHS